VPGEGMEVGDRGDSGTASGDLPSEKHPPLWKRRDFFGTWKWALDIWITPTEVDAL